MVAGSAVLLNLLSVGAAYGLFVLIFQHEIGAGLFGFQHAQTIEAWVPPFLEATPKVIALVVSPVWS